MEDGSLIHKKARFLITYRLIISMQLIKTNDGSFTFFSEKYGETFKSVSGALEEAEKKFIIPCNIRDNISILDIGFGLGYNIVSAMRKAKSLRIISLEKDKELFDQIQTFEVPEQIKENYSKIRIAAKNMSYKDNEYQIDIILGNAEETIKNIKEEFDAVFLDPFSPKKNTELWTLEFLKDVFAVMKKGAVLSTYSCAGQIRRNLIAVGFEVKEGPIVGRRAPSTIAVKV